ncbi:MAG: hypothetical protein LZ166_05620 [Thaumarchaeota archaeon]|nr:hypothetical protein [Candidatus Wolframiiraptor allenii]
MRRILLGPFSDVYRRGNLLFFKTPEEYRDRVLEDSLKPGLAISPGRIMRAYKDRLGRYWILVEYVRGYDLYKHFRLAPMRDAWRIPRITVEVCPACGEDVVEGVCLECGERVEKPRHLEVWRDREAVEELIPVTGIRRGVESLVIESETGQLEIPKGLIHERMLSIVRRGGLIYIKLLKLLEGSKQS